MRKRHNRVGVIRTDMQSDLHPMEQAALAAMRVQKGEHPVQHFEETRDPVPDIRRNFFQRLFKR